MSAGRACAGAPCWAIRAWTPLTSLTRSSFLMSWPLTLATTAGNLSGLGGGSVAGGALGGAGAPAAGGGAAAVVAGAPVVAAVAGAAGLSPWALAVALSLAREQPTPARSRRTQERESGRSRGRGDALGRFMADSLRGTL